MNILLIQLKRIGDLILTTPTIAALREKFPDAQLSLVVSSACQELLPAIAGIDRVYILRGQADDFIDWLRLASANFDYCLDFTRNDRSAFLTLLSRAKKRITSDHPNLRTKIRARSYNEFVECPVRQLHTIDYHLSLLEPLGIRDASPAIQLQLPDDATKKAAAFLQAAKIDGGFIILHPGSARAEKFWEAERWARVIDHCVGQRGIRTVLTGGSLPIEQAQIAATKSATKFDVTDFSGLTDLLTLAALVQKARLLITVDSAPMHFAAAWRTPQVVLFGPTNPFHWHPREAPAAVLLGEADAPLAEFLPKQRAVPMNQISTQSVIDAMESLLSAPAAPAT